MFALDAGRATGLGFCLSQAPILILVMLYYREPQALIFTARVTNATTMEARADGEPYGLSGLYAAVSFLTAMFALMTAQMQEQDLLNNLTEFSPELLHGLAAWDLSLWGVHGLGRALLLVQICSPVDAYLVALGACGQTLCVHALCSPQTDDRRYHSVHVVLFMLLAATVYGEMRSHHGLRLALWAASIAADGMLVMGHAFERHRNMETVANCRVFYCSFVTFVFLLLYTV